MSDMGPYDLRALELYRALREANPTLARLNLTVYVRLPECLQAPAARVVPEVLDPSA